MSLNENGHNISIKMVYEIIYAFKTIRHLKPTAGDSYMFSISPHKIKTHSVFFIERGLRVTALNGSKFNLP